MGICVGLSEKKYRSKAWKPAFAQVLSLFMILLGGSPRPIPRGLLGPIALAGNSLGGISGIPHPENPLPIHIAKRERGKEKGGGEYFYPDKLQSKADWCFPEIPIWSTRCVLLSKLPTSDSTAFCLTSAILSCAKTRLSEQPSTVSRSIPCLQASMTHSGETISLLEPSIIEMPNGASNFD